MPAYIVYSSDVVYSFYKCTIGAAAEIGIRYDFGTMMVKEVGGVCLACLQAHWRFIEIPAEALLKILLKFMVEN